MNNPALTSVSLDTAAIPLYLLVPVLLLLLALWVRAHGWSRDLAGRWTRMAAFAGRVFVGFLTLEAAAGLIRKGMLFSTSWSLWPLMLAGAGLVEWILALSRLERNVISPRAGRALVILRISTVLAVLLVLCQPVRVFDAIRRIQRNVIVLLDASASMQVPDNNLTDGEKVRLAESLHIAEARRPVAVDRVLADLRETGQALQAQSEAWNALAVVSPDIRVRQMERNLGGWGRTFKQKAKAVNEAVKALQSAAAAPCVFHYGTQHAEPLRKAASRLWDEGVQPLKGLVQWADDKRAAATNDAAFQSARETLRKTAALLIESANGLEPSGDGFDEAFYRSLPPDQRKAIDRVATLSRMEIAGQLLLNRPLAETQPGKQPPPGILEKLHRGYGVQFHTFGAFPAGMGTPALLRATDADLWKPDEKQKVSTDIATALERVTAGVPAERLAGVVLLTDGRHNAPAAVESVARRLGVQKIPVFPVVSGAGRHPPTDAAIVSLAAPESVSTNDKVSFTVDLKIDGLNGTNVLVTLLDGDTVVASNTVTPQGLALRRQILLSDTPKTNGLHPYRVRVESFPAEVDRTNNEREMPVMVSQDAVKVLLVDSYPRWEFRYLKNLFLQRDKHVRLQYLLFHPDKVAGLTNRVPRAASVMAGPGEVEANLPPASEAEWMKFDVIILGDVAPDDLGPVHQRILRDYVIRRGGTLIVLCGMRHMPHAYTGSPLAEVLPVAFTPSARPLLAAPEAEFRLGLTGAGRNSVFLRMDDDAARNLAVWNSLPILYWRNGSIRAKEGATVLAYAEAAKPGSDEPVLRMPDAETLAQQRRTEKEKPLLVTHQEGFGTVLLFGFDHAWRLRYRKGDEYHHKLWGQILRWGTSERIAAGTGTIRVGTSLTRYQAGEPVRVMARLATPDYLPIQNASPAALIESETGTVRLRRMLRYRVGTPGIYSAEIGALPEGRYRVTLDTGGIAAGEGEPGVISSRLSVVGANDSETVELAADRGLMNHVASLTGGRVLGPGDLPSVSSQLGPARIIQVERRQVDLWNSWPLWLLIVLLLTAEWILRKKVRLP